MKHAKVKKRECASTTKKNGQLNQLVRSGNLRVLKEVLKDADINMTYDNDETLLTIAAKCCKNVDIIKELLKCGTNVNAQNRLGDTPLILAIKSGEKSEVVKTLLEHRANVHASNMAGDTALSQAVKCRRSVKIIKNLLEYGSNDQVAITTLLTEVIRYDKRLKVLKEFLKHGADVNAANNKNDKPLDVAIISGASLAVVTELLKFGAEVNSAGNANYTPLIHAIMRNDAKIVKELLQWGADANATNDMRATPLHLALELGRDVEMIKLLLLHGADANAISNIGDTPLNLAANSYNNLELYKELLAYGANVNVIDNIGFTPLIWAIVYHGCPEIILELLAYGADPNVANREGEKPLYLALRHCASMDVIKALVNHGACTKSGSKGGIGLLNYVYSDTRAKFLIKHAMIENFEGDYTSIINIDCYKQSPRYMALSCYLEKCFREILKMRDRQVSRGVSLYEILTMKNLNVALFPSNKNVINMEVGLMADYPIYHDMVSPKIKHAVKRGALLKQLSNVDVYTKVLPSEVKAENKIIGLTSACTAIIAKFLSNADLRNFILSFCIPNQSGDEVVESSPSSATNFKRQRAKQIAGGTLGNCSKMARFE